METMERLSALIQQAQGKLTTAQAIEILVQLVALRASLRPVI